MDFNNQKAVEIYTEKKKLFEAEEIIFKDYLSTPCKILDLGCGAGRTTRFLKDMGHDVIGVDIAPMQIEQARRLHPDIDFRVGDATKLNFKDQVFDFVLFSFNGIDTIYPETERVQAMKQIHSVLKPGGGFIYSSHDLSFTRNNKRNWRRKPRHYKGFYYKERTVYAPKGLLMYYGTVARNRNTLRACGFKNSKYYESFGKGWRYYIAWA